jgi:N-sulfoglucosamine sulfohydrolase
MNYRDRMRVDRLGLFSLVAIALAGVATEAVIAAQTAGGAAPSPKPSSKPKPTRLNLLLITADDLSYDSVGVYGGKVAGATPNIDALAAQGMRFTHGHVTIAVCQPSRSVLLTGRYPHRNGARGFEPIGSDVPTLTEQLHQAGYLNGILGKTRHLAPAAKFAWDFRVERAQLAEGRSPERYHAEVRRFLALARQRGQPFFLMANSHDPHRPFAGSQQEQRQRQRGAKQYPEVRDAYRPGDVAVPGFLPDLPAVRREIAEYFTSVRRGDATVGKILQALRESGFERDTLVLFLSDNGMALPFAKTNVYLASTKVPWIVRWPGVVVGGAVDRKHFVSGIDCMATLLEAAGLPRPAGMDGRSFVPVLRGGTQDGREEVLTVFHRTSGRRDYPMRCLQDRRFGYIRNAWADGQRVFRNESQAGLTFRAMTRAAATDPDLARRVELYVHRVAEELYDFAADPNARINLAADPAHAEVLAEMRRRLIVRLEAVGDPDVDSFRMQSERK